MAASYTHIPLKLNPRRGSRCISDIPRAWLVVNPLSSGSSLISCGSALNPLVAFYDIRGINWEMLFFCPVTSTIQYCHRLSRTMDIHSIGITNILWTSFTPWLFNYPRKLTNILRYRCTLSVVVEWSFVLLPLLA
jgi:hypothetical protein